jgi:hypothetical protein
MKNLLTICLILLVSAGAALAADAMLETTIDSVTIAMDKNGNEYVRAIITEPRELNGVSYNRSLPLMFFGPMVEAGKQLKAGDQVRVIASYREFDSRPSYTALQLVP